MARPRTSDKPATYRRVRIVSALTDLERRRQELVHAAAQSEQQGYGSAAEFAFHRAQALQETINHLLFEFSVDRNEIAAGTA